MDPNAESDTGRFIQSITQKFPGKNRERREHPNIKNTKSRGTKGIKKQLNPQGKNQKLASKNSAKTVLTAKERLTKRSTVTRRQSETEHTNHGD